MMKKGNRVLILGAGPQQLSLIRYAIECGCYVVVSDRNPNAPGIAMASAYAQSSMLDIDKNIAIAQSYNVDAVTTGGSDQVMLTVASIAQACGLPCHLTPETAYRATNKAAMAKAFMDAGVPITKRILIRNHSDVQNTDKLKLPLVVKPVDSQGQLGVVRIDNRSNLSRSIETAMNISREKVVVVEEFMEGKEVTAGAWLQNGKLYIIAVTDRVTYNPYPSLGISLRHILPSESAIGSLFSIGDILEKVAKAYEVTNGPLHAQLIITPDGPFVIEVGSRYGGANEVSLYNHVLGVNEIKYVLNLAFGQESNVNFDIRYNKPLCYGLINLVVAKQGVLAFHEPMNSLIDSGVIVDGGWYHDNGFIQQPITDAYGRIGWFVVTGESRQSIINNATLVYSKLKVLNKSGENLVFWPDEQYLN